MWSKVKLEYGLCAGTVCFLRLICNTVCFQGEEGPPSLEYIQARDLFPQKELLREDDALQVSFIPNVHVVLCVESGSTHTHTHTRLFSAVRIKSEV